MDMASSGCADRPARHSQVPPPATDPNRPRRKRDAVAGRAEHPAMSDRSHFQHARSRAPTALPRRATPAPPTPTSPRRPVVVARRSFLFGTLRFFGLFRLLFVFGLRSFSFRGLWLELGLFV